MARKNPAPGSMASDERELRGLDNIVQEHLKGEHPFRGVPLPRVEIWSTAYDPEGKRLLPAPEDDDGS